MKIVGKPKETIKIIKSKDKRKPRQQKTIENNKQQTIPIPLPISNTIKEQFITWLKSLDPNNATNNEVKRFRQKDGYFRESHVRGFVDLINYFIENYKEIIKKLEMK
jgi:hypothetical protein